MPVNNPFSLTFSGNITEWDSVLLGAPSAYGTSPGAVNVIGVNAYVTSLPAVTIAASQTIAATNTGLFAVQASITTLGQQLAAASVPVVLTAAQISALTPLSTVAISNFPVTQPVSGTVSISGSVAVTGTFFQATQPVSGTIAATQSGTWSVGITTLGQQLAAASVPVVLTAAQITALTPLATVAISNFPVSQAVTGTFFQATQPVSIAASVAVTGTFFQATQPVSGTIAATQSGTWNIGSITTLPAVTIAASQTIAVTNAGTFAVQATQAGTWNIGTITTLPAITLAAAQTLATVTTVTAVTAITNALPAGTNTIGKVDILGNAGGILDAVIAAAVPANAIQVGASDGTNLQPLSINVKGTQGARGLATQQLHDAGRNTRIFMLDTITAAPVAEALASVVQWYGNAAVAATTTPAVVPAGKTLRLNSWKIQYQSLATVGYAVVRIRVNTAGVVALASPLAFSFEAGSGAGATTVAMTGGVITETGDFPEGFEIPAGSGVGFTVAGYGPTGTLTLEGGVRFAVVGYEY